MGRRDHDPIGEMRGPSAVVDEDRVRDDRCRCVAVGRIHVDIDLVRREVDVAGDEIGAVDRSGKPADHHVVDGMRREDFEGGLEGRLGQAVGVAADVERAIRALRRPIPADRLGRRDDVRFVERAVQR